ncbi:hypothetical protein Pla52nx_001373 [Stieleria varia]
MVNALINALINVFRHLALCRMFPRMVSIVVLAWIGCPSSVSAQTSSVTESPHTVWLAPAQRASTDSTWYPRAITIKSGLIASLDGQHLAIRLAGDDALTKIAAQRVIWVRSLDRSDAESTAVRLYLDGQYGDALLGLINALGSEDDPSDRPPIWRQQWLSMLAADAAWRTNRAEISLELVSQLDQRSLAPMSLASLPIAWTPMPRERAVAAITAATTKTNEQSDAVRLVCASWLLESPTQRAEAEAILDQLAANTKRPLIAGLVDQLRWKLASPRDVTDRWIQWEQSINDLPPSLQAGPLELLVAKMESAGLAEDALRIKLSLELTPLVEKVE